MNDIFLRACRGEAVEYTPVWIMRQAGRYLPQYQKIREKVDFLTLCKTPELAAEVTVQPVDILGVDAAILFSDILIPVEAMGMRLRFYEKRGPVLSRPIRSLKSVKKLKPIKPEEDVPFVLKTIKILRRRLRRKVPLIGFAGAPFTLATYMIEGGTSKHFVYTKTMMFKTPDVFHSLMETVTDSTIRYLSAQIKAGVQAIQIFDSWAGVLSPDDYRLFSLPYVIRIVEELSSSGIPIIYFVNNCAGLLEEIKKVPSEVIGIDWRVDIADAIKRLGKDRVIQGNLDPTALFSDPATLREKVIGILRKAKKAKGHIFNLGHGILPQSSPEMAKRLVEMVHEFSSK
jgi:uroporphyrinogen decarboxylase